MREPSKAIESLATLLQESDAKPRFAEYFLIGTLLSIGLAVIGGLVLAKLWYGTMSLK